MTHLSLVIPLYNEEGVVPALIRRLRAVLGTLGVSYEVLFVDDGSRDHTLDLLVEEARNFHNLKIIRLSRNFGHQAAVSAGIDHASGEAIIIIDGDLQDPPELIPAMLARHKEGYDIVHMVREARSDPLWKRVAIKVFYRVLRRASGDVEIPLDSGDFSLISRRAAEVIKKIPERNRYMRGLRAWMGFNQTSLFYTRESRKLGKSKYTFARLLKLAYDGIFSFSYAPITLVSISGFIFAALSFAGIGAALYFRFLTETQIPGWTSTAILLLFFGGIQLLSLGIIGEYIRRIYDETKHRPLYIIKDKIGF